MKQQGLGDIELGAKYRFLQETDSRPMMAIYPIVVTRSGDANKGLGSGGVQIFLPVWIQKSWGDWQSYGGGGYLINKAPGAQNSWSAGWALQNNVSERLTLGGELFRTSKQFSADIYTRGGSLGGIYKLDQHNRLLFSFRRVLTGLSTQDTFARYIAYGLTW
jgi:hypothetical protein